MMYDQQKCTLRQECLMFIGSLLQTQVKWRVVTIQRIGQIQGAVVVLYPKKAAILDISCNIRISDEPLSTLLSYYNIGVECR